MNTVDQLLIRQNITPTLIKETDKENLSAWLVQVERGDLSSFVCFAKSAATEFSAAKDSLFDCTDRLLQLASATSQSIDAVLAEFESEPLSFSSQTDRRALTKGHLKMLEQIEQIKLNTMTLAAQSASLLRDAKHTYLSQDRITELHLRHIALCQNSHSPLHQHYECLCRQAEPFSQALTSAFEQTVTLIGTMYEQLSAFAKSSSDSITAVNKKTSTPTEYYKLLRAFLLPIHTLAETAKHIRKETDHVEIPDVI